MYLGCGKGFLSVTEISSTGLHGEGYSSGDKQLISSSR